MGSIIPTQYCQLVNIVALSDVRIQAYTKPHIAQKTYIMCYLPVNNVCLQ
jgi:hypothetical protein